MRPDGKVVIVGEIVEWMGDEAQSCPELEGQLAVLIRIQRVVDERIHGKDASQCIAHLGVVLEIEPKVGMVEGDTDIGIMVNRFPLVLAVGALVDGDLKGRISGIEPAHLEMMMPKDPGVYPGFRHEVVIVEPDKILPPCGNAIEHRRKQQQHLICFSASHPEQNCKSSHFIFEMCIFAV